MNRYGGFGAYESVGVKQQKAQKMLKKLKKTMPNMMPVTVTGNNISNTWWGKSWNQNLSSYADFGNRIARGRLYVKHGFLLDLQINEGKINGIVYGSSGSAYLVNVLVSPMADDKWTDLVQQAGQKVSDIAAISAGFFPKELEDVLLTQSSGVFPSPSEISMSCTCPDSAVICKHVAAVILGVGNRLDSDPLLFFTLRGIDYHELLQKSMDEKVGLLIKNADKKSDRIFTGDIDTLFGL